MRVLVAISCACVTVAGQSPPLKSAGPLSMKSASSLSSGAMQQLLSQALTRLEGLLFSVDSGSGDQATYVVKSGCTGSPDAPLTPFLQVFTNGAPADLGTRLVGPHLTRGFKVKRSEMHDDTRGPIKFDTYGSKQLYDEVWVDADSLLPIEWDVQADQLPPIRYAIVYRPEAAGATTLCMNESNR